MSALAAAANDAGVRILTLDDALRDAPAWAASAGTAIEPNLLVGPEMVGSAAGTVAPADWSVATVRTDAGTLASLAIQRTARAARLLGPTVVETFWSPYAPLGTPLVADVSPATVGGLLDAWADLGPVVRMRYQRLDGPFVRALTAAAEARGIAVEVTDVHERAILEPGLPPDRTLGPTLKGKRARDLKRLQRRLEERGAVRFETVTTPEALHDALGAHVALEDRGWKGRRRSSFAADPARLAFVRRLVGGLAAGGRVRIDRLLLDECPVASLITLNAGPRAYLWKIAIDETVGDASPGLQLAASFTMSAMEAGNWREVDSLAAPGHPLVDRLWAGRARLGTLIFPTKADHNGEAARVVMIHDGEQRLRRLVRTLRDRFGR